jgi:SAM-dependent methyltransferase
MGADLQAAQRQEAQGPSIAQQEYLRAVWVSLARACGGKPARVALFGAGRHTHNWLASVGELSGPKVEAIVDDAARPGQTLLGVPVVRPVVLDELDLDAVIISSDACEEEIARRHPGFIRLYDGGGPPRPRLLAGLAWVGLRPWRDIEWLLSNAGERGDWSLPTREAARKNFHLDRYERALRYTRGKRVLDLGCGTGWGSALLARRGAANVLGVDISPECADYAARHHGQRASFCAASALSLPVADHSIDLICCFEVIEHLPDGLAFFEECRRVLAPGGLLILSTPNNWPPTPFHINTYSYPRLRTEIHRYFDLVRFENQNSGIDRATNRGQPRGFHETTPDNANLAECFFVSACVRG